MSPASSAVASGAIERPPVPAVVDDPTAILGSLLDALAADNEETMRAARDEARSQAADILAAARMEANRIRSAAKAEPALTWVRLRESTVPAGPALDPRPRPQRPVLSRIGEVLQEVQSGLRHRRS